MANMNTAVLAAFALWGFCAAPASAAPRDYRFEAVHPVLDTSRSRVATVRLTHRPSGRAVTDATIVESRLLMPMQGMSTMPGRARHLPPANGGLTGEYHFEIVAPMEEEWLLVLTAKVPGETDLVRGTVPLYIEHGQSPHDGAPRRTHEAEDEENEDEK